MKTWIRAGLGVAILAGGFAINGYMVSTKPEAKQSDITAKATPVEVVTVESGSTHITVKARGTVVPARQVVLGTEVGGKVIKISENLQPGGKFVANEVIARINPADYRLAVEQQFAMVDNAQAQLAIEESRRAVAKREWEMFGNKRDGANKSLALREPQLRSATTSLKSARSGLKRARLGVERTIMRAPFDGMVQVRNVELGQIVAPGAPLLTYVGTDVYWVQVSIPVERLAWIHIPAQGEKGSPVTIHHRVGKQHIQRKGHVLRLLGDVDPAGHMARVVIEVEDPLGTSETKGASGEIHTEEPRTQTSELPLLLGSYVEVEIEGRDAADVIELDRSALRNGKEVFVYSDDNTLEIRPVEVLWRWENAVVLSGGLKPGERVIVSPVSSAVAGMKLRLPGTKASAPSEPAEAAKTKAPEKSAKPAEKNPSQPAGTEG